jgi:hypothetical protein
MNTPAAKHLAQDIVGVWWLLSREDRSADGSPRVDPSLGADPIGILTYTSSRFAAQFMKRDRSPDIGADPSAQGKNNTGAIGGYDAYFGTYEVIEATGAVLHRLEGALTPENVGMEVSRNLQVDDDRLVIRLDTSTAEGEAISRTLTWQRIG